MMKVSNTSKNSAILYFLLFITSYLLICWALLQEIEYIYTINLVVDVVCLMIIIMLLAHYSQRNKFDIFDPLYFSSAIYLLMFFITPIYDILMGNYEWYGYSLFRYGVKSSVIAFFGYIFMYVGYSVNFRLHEKVYPRNYVDTKNTFKPEINQRIMLLVIYCMYIVSFLANVFYLVNSGFGNFLYIITLGLLGTGNDNIAESNIGFISMLSYSLPTIVLLVWEYSNKKVLKVLLFIPMFMLQVARGYRFFIIQIVVTFVTYYYLKKQKRPSIKSIILLLTFLMFFVLVMTMFRTSISGGAGIDLSMITGETISNALDAAIWENLRIYQNVYGMIAVIPSKYPYVWLRQIFIGTLVMTIPRALWPNKISSYGGEGLKVLIGRNIAAGQAYPTLGEYYYAFGIMGVIVFMAIYGKWLKKLKNKYMHSHDPLDLIYFSVLLGCCLQLIIRGYFPSNFWYLLFAVLPIWVVKLL